MKKILAFLMIVWIIVTFSFLFLIAFNKQDPALQNELMFYIKTLVMLGLILGTITHFWIRNNQY